jgi:hypothetical protein
MTIYSGFPATVLNFMKKEKGEEKYLVFIPSAGLGYNVVT